MTKPKAQVAFAMYISPKHNTKLNALCKFGMFDPVDFAGLLLEQAIDDAWEGYRKNPKHSKQIMDWEAKNK